MCVILIIWVRNSVIFSVVFLNLGTAHTLSYDGFSVDPSFLTHNLVRFDEAQDEADGDEEVADCTEYDRSLRVPGE